MTVICVDDEPLIVELTVSMCRELPQVHEAVGFSRPREALAWLESHNADAAVLDIEMPEMNGILLAAGIKELRPDTGIIFLTGYSQYAVEAFALRASGYLLKPVSPERLAAELDYVRSLRPRPPEGRIFIKTFGGFDLFVGGAPAQFSRSKAKELLARLVDRRGGTLSRPQAFALLWPGGAYTRPMQKQLDVVIRSLRATLRDCGADGIVEIRSGNLRILPEAVECDLYRFLQGRTEAVNAYRGDYLPEYAWATGPGQKTQPLQTDRNGSNNLF